VPTEIEELSILKKWFENPVCQAIDIQDGFEGRSERRDCCGSEDRQNFRVSGEDVEIC
jgi:hypothetical protein